MVYRKIINNNRRLNISIGLQQSFTRILFKKKHKHGYKELKRSYKSNLFKVNGHDHFKIKIVKISLYIVIVSDLGKMISTSMLKKA